MTSRRMGWIGGTALLVLVILAGTWFLVASPRFDAAAETQNQAEEARSRNELLETQLIQLRGDFARMDEYRAELAGLQVQMPPDALLDELTGVIEEIADTHDVDVLEIAPGVSTNVTVAVPAPDPAAAPETPADDGAESTGAEGSDGPEDPAEGAAPSEPEVPQVPQVDGLVAVPLMVKVLGSYGNVMAFMENYQTGHGRLVLVTDYIGTRQKDEDAAGGKRATEDGDLELEIRGYAYVLRNPLVLAVTDGEDVEEERGELPSSDRNPFEPLAPTRGGGGGDD